MKAKRIRWITWRILLLFPVLLLLLVPGCSPATLTPTAGTSTASATTASLSTMPPATIASTAAPSTVPPTSVATIPPTTATVPPTAAPTTTAPTTAAPVPSAGTVYRLAEVRDYVFDGIRTPAMPSPVRVTDGYAAFLTQLSSDVLATSHSSEIHDYTVLFTCTGPNGPGVTARDPLTTTTKYSWTVPATLTAGTMATLTASGSQHVTAAGGISVWTAGELYFTLYGGMTRTFDMDFRGDGIGQISIESAFGSVLPALTPGQTISNGTYPLAIPAGPSRTLAIEVMFMPFDGNRSLHRVYFYQP